MQRMLIALLLAVSACIVDPVDNVWAPSNGIQKLWGFVPDPGAAVSIVALNSTNGWEVVATGTASTRTTYTGTLSGSYWELNVNIATLPTRFKNAGKVKLRAQVGTWYMRTRSADQQRARVESSTLVEFWNAYVNTNDSTITIWL